MWIITGLAYAFEMAYFYATREPDWTMTQGHTSNK